MKLAKKLESEILKTYNSYWENYLKGDVEAMHPLLADEYTQVGSAESEVFSNKKDAVQFLYDTIDQVAGKLEMRNRKTILEQLEDAVLLHEFCDLYALANNNWIFYSKFRASTLMEQKKSGWKIIHQHSSFPDTKAEDGQNIAIDKIAAENLELRDAVKRRTIELEQKNRELEIETTLERVRARTMAMQQSNELPEAANLLFQQVQLLGIPAWSAGYCIWDEDLPAGQAGKQGITLWMSSEGVMQPSFHAPLTKDPSFIHMREAYEKGESFHVEEVGGKALVAHYKYMRTLPVVGDVLDSIIEAGHPLPVFQIFHCVYFSQGFLLFITYEPVPEAHEIFKRFGKVFDQTYTRFLDLQKAETQAKEAQIELALERVRARTMAMQHSDELRETVLVIYEQLQQLDFASHACNIIIIDKDTLDMQFWVSGFTQEIYPESYHIPRLHHTYHEVQIAAWQKSVKYQVFEYSGKGKIDFDKIFFTKTDFKNVPEDAKKVMIDLKTLMLSTAFFNYGALQVLGAKVLSDDKAKTLQRFAKVFDQTYTRFLDLQKAEAQAKEAQIEAALERVRSRTMAMHKSDELKEIIMVVSEQLQKLGYKFSNVSFITHNKNYDLNFWLSAAGIKEPFLLQVPYFDNPAINNLKNAIESDSWFYTDILTPDENLEWLQHLIKTTWLKDAPQETKNYLLRHTPFAKSNLRNRHIVLAIGNYAGIPYTDEQNEVFKRFTNVFEQSYTRFLDLQKAEAQAREAKIEASLERMRSVAMSIRKSEELILVAESLYKELKGLGITNIRNAQIVIKIEGDGMYLVCVYADDTAEVFKESRYDTSPITQQMYDELDVSEEALYLKELTGKEFEQWLDWRKGTATKIDAKLLEARAVIFGLYSIGKGHLGISAYNNITGEQLDILKRFRNVFELSYRRFIDIAKSEEQALKLQQEKERLELTLSKLQAAQKQLIQSEKMASLGELTAGIAHEIQNPLNFVNNFSEINKELLVELKEEIKKGNINEVNAIANDVISNEEKINHHGKRADAIVKGMLQHSRITNNATKEPADINKLADEYLRLAYHGLRAKDKTFNAAIKTDYDETIGNINIIPQDIGRVILNLITNAFYVVNEKSKQGIADYQPTVTVSTSCSPFLGRGAGGEVSISVKDNGNGIPQKILDKIFQPFFTTKPTGQGTGLGLSLSYDIVKAHGGELKVETKEAEGLPGEQPGTEFIILLPV